MTVVIGIDIGLSGSIARLGPGLAPSLVDIPSVPDGPPRAGKDNKVYQPRRINGRQLLDLLHQICPVGHAVLAVFEDVRARPMGNAERHFNSFHSQNALVLARGVVQAALDIAGFDSVAVQPQSWKAFYGLTGAEKQDSLEMARRLFPAMASQLARQKDHNRAEALLLAHHAQKTRT